jgi:hypothetical protein
VRGHRGDYGRFGGAIHVLQRPRRQSFVSFSVRP